MRETRNIRLDERGVSELIGFVVVFGIIISSVGLLYMTGFQAMGDYQEMEQTKNAERAMDALAENINDIIRNDGVRYRAGELTLREGTISYNETGTTITANKTLVGSSKKFNGSGSFIYDHEDTAISYEGGAVIRSADNANWTVRNPPIRCSANGTIISLVEIDGDGSAVTAHGSQEITAIQQNSTAKRFKGSVNISITSDKDEAWNRTLIDSGWEPDDGKDDVYDCDTEGGVIRKTTIEIDYD